MNSLVFRFLIILLLSGAAPSWAHVQDSVRLEKKGKQTFVVHKVEKGETLYSLSRRYEVEVKVVQKANDDKTALSIGQILNIPISEDLQIQDLNRPKIHVVQSGETLYKISRHYSVTVEEIKTWNNLVNSNLSLGQKLMVSRPVSSPQKETVANEPQSKEKKYATHQVKKGETLYGIAKMYEVSIRDLRQWNGLEKYAELKENQVLLLKNKVILVDSSEPTFRTKKPIIEKGVVLAGEHPLFSTEFSECLHKTAAIGSIVKIETKTGDVVWVKVVGKLDDNIRALVKINKKALERFSAEEIAFTARVCYLPLD